MSIKIAIITTHPIQYNAPFFKLLAQQEDISLKVFYTWGSAVMDDKFDPGFGKQINWDIPLLDGYEYEFLENVAVNPGSHQHKGIDNPGILDTIEKFKPSAILVFGWNFKSHLRVLRYFKNKIPVFFRGDSTLLNAKPGLKAIARTLYLRWVYNFVDFALYVGENNKQYFLRHGLKPVQLIYAPHAVDIGRFKESNQEYTEKATLWKKKLGIDPNQITVLYAGKLEPVKNLSFLLLLADALKSYPVKFIIVGNGPLEQELKQKAKGNSKVIFIDFQNQSMMPVIYRLGDIFLLCSKSETWGLGANEAMACESALALSDKVGGAPDLVQTDNGIVFKLSEPKICIEFLKDCIANKHRLNDMKSASGKLSEKFSFYKIIEPFVQKLHSIKKPLDSF